MKKHILSPYFRTIEDKSSGKTMIFHSLFGNPRIINEEGMRFLNLFRQPVMLHEALSACDDDAQNVVKEFTESSFIVEANMDERKILQEKKSQHLQKVCTGKVVDRMGLAISNACNLSCDQCIHFQSTGVSQELLNMNWGTAKRCIDYYISLMRKNESSVCKIHFGNAEPLINWPVIERILLYCAEIKDLTFDFAINTNLMLMTKEIAQILKKHRVSIATSLDGILRANDAIRTTKSGNGTFKQIVEKFDLLDDIGYPLDGFSVTVTDKNYNLVGTDIIDLAAKRGMTSISFDYDLVGIINIPSEMRADKIMLLKRYANERNIDFFGTWDSVFRNLTSESLLLDAYAFCAAVEGRSLEFDVNGEIKVCGHTTTQIGHITQTDKIFERSGGLSDLVKKRFPGNDGYCFGCIIEGSCGGQCQVTREMASRSNSKQQEKLFDDMCDFYRSITEALAIDYMRQNYNKTSGTDLMPERR